MTEHQHPVLYRSGRDFEAAMFPRAVAERTAREDAERSEDAGTRLAGAAIDRVLAGAKPV